MVQAEFAMDGTGKADDESVQCSIPAESLYLGHMRASFCKSSLLQQLGCEI